MDSTINIFLAWTKSFKLNFIGDETSHLQKSGSYVKPVLNCHFTLANCNFHFDFQSNIAWLSLLADATVFTAGIWQVGGKACY